MDSDEHHSCSDDIHHINDLYLQSFCLNRKKEDLMSQPIIDNIYSLSTFVLSTALFPVAFIHDNIFLGALATCCMGTGCIYIYKKYKDKQNKIENINKKINEVDNELREYKNL